MDMQGSMPVKLVLVEVISHFGEEVVLLAVCVFAAE